MEVRNETKNTKNSKVAKKNKIKYEAKSKMRQIKIISNNKCKWSKLFS